MKAKEKWVGKCVFKCTRATFISYVAFPLSKHFVDEVKVISSTQVVTNAQWTKCLPREFWKEIEESNLEIPGLLWEEYPSCVWGPGLAWECPHYWQDWGTRDTERLEALLFEYHLFGKKNKSLIC